MLSLRLLRIFSTIAVGLALLVVTLGAYTRLTDAGLGCPDWPGCYGHLVLPHAKNALLETQSHYPMTVIEPKKAWTEMVHRYAAGTLVVLILIVVICIRCNRQTLALPARLPFLLLVLLGFQAVLGMWTVTLKLLPVVVMAHLVGGMLIVACLCSLRMHLSSVPTVFLPKWQWGIRLGMVLVLCQIALGGWVSANYAGLACIGFPKCNGVWLPTLHFAKGFYLFSPVGVNYQGGVLDAQIRTTIQVIHRLGAVVVMSYVCLLSFLLLRQSTLTALRRMVMVVMMMVLVQVGIGIINVVYLLPLKWAVLHNAGAALLLATLFILHDMVSGEKTCSV